MLFGENLDVPLPIVLQIFSYLPEHEFRNLLLVCKQWNAGAKELLKNKTDIELKFINNTFASEFLKGLNHKYQISHLKFYYLAKFYRKKKIYKIKDEKIRKFYIDLFLGNLEDVKKSIEEENALNYFIPFKLFLNGYEGQTFPMLYPEPLSIAVLSGSIILVRWILNILERTQIAYSHNFPKCLRIAIKHGYFQIFEELETKLLYAKDPYGSGRIYSGIQQLALVHIDTYAELAVYYLRTGQYDKVDQFIQKYGNPIFDHFPFLEAVVQSKQIDWLEKIASKHTSIALGFYTPIRSPYKNLSEKDKKIAKFNIIVDAIIILDDQGKLDVAAKYFACIENWEDTPYMGDISKLINKIHAAKNERLLNWLISYKHDDQNKELIGSYIKGIDIVAFHASSENQKKKVEQIALVNVRNAELEAQKVLDEFSKKHKLEITKDNITHWHAKVRFGGGVPANFRNVAFQETIPHSIRSIMQILQDTSIDSVQKKSKIAQIPIDRDNEISQKCFAFFRKHLARNNATQEVHDDAMRLRQS